MPEFSPQVVVNATPIISLALISQIDLLHQFYGKVIIPPAVQSEVLAGGTQGVGRVELSAADWIEMILLQDPSRADLLADLDRGEAEVIALAQELNADLVIID